MTKKKIIGIVLGVIITIIVGMIICDCINKDVGYSASYVINIFNNKASKTSCETDKKNTVDSTVEKSTDNPKPTKMSGNSNIEANISPKPTDIDSTKKPKATKKVNMDEHETIKNSETKKPVATKKATAKPIVTKKPESTVKPSTDKKNEENKKKAYLTFDDGPSENTLKIIDILNKYEAKATFFVIYHKDSEDLYKKICDSGNTIALHTYSHEYSNIYKSEENYYKDLTKIHDYVLDITGVDTNIIRFPGGSSNAVSKRYCRGIMTKLVKSTEEKGYSYFDWNVDSSDASAKLVDTKDIINNTLNGAKHVNDAYVLMHDTSVKTTTVDALPKIIEGLKKQGYTLEAVSNDTQVCHHSIVNN